MSYYPSIIATNNSNMTQEASTDSFLLSEEDFKALVDRVATSEEAGIEPEEGDIVPEEDDTKLLLINILYQLTSIIKSIIKHNPLFLERDIENTKSTKDSSFMELPNDIYVWLKDCGDSIAKDFIKRAYPTKFAHIIKAFDAGETEFCSAIESLEGFDKLSNMVHLDRIWETLSFEENNIKGDLDTSLVEFQEELECLLPYDWKLTDNISEIMNFTTRGLGEALLMELNTILVWTKHDSLKTAHRKRVMNIFNHPILISYYNACVDILSITQSEEYPYFSGEYDRSETEYYYDRKYHAPSRKELEKLIQGSGSLAKATKEDIAIENNNSEDSCSQEITCMPENPVFLKEEQIDRFCKHFASHCEPRNPAFIKWFFWGISPENGNLLCLPPIHWNSAADFFVTYVRYIYMNINREYRDLPKGSITIIKKTFTCNGREGVKPLDISGKNSNQRYIKQIEDALNGKI